MSIALKVLKEKNEYPIVFIGSGISKRYLKDFPSWEELLEKCWLEAGETGEFYAYLNTLRKSLREENPDVNDGEIKYLTNILAGTEIEQIYNNAFLGGKVFIDNFTQKDAYKLDISPFKRMLANKFSNYSIIEEMESELTLFKKFLNKAQIMMTTNYDPLIEDSFNSVNPRNGIKKYVGQSGFFEQTLGWAELYKLHGSVEKPESIVISKADYDLFEKNSILISAKIISLLINSPIIFLGYSLTDMNIRKIIRDFSSSLTPSEIKNMGSRIIIVEFEEGKHNIEEYQYYENDLGCEYTVLKTDNFKELYNKLSEINQGISPAEVRRYQHVMKQLIVDNGKKGSLNTLLIAPEQLEEIEKRIGDGNIIVALGDAAYIFRMPDFVSYIHEYFFSENNIPTEIGLRFIANQNGRIPLLKIVKDVNIDETSLYPKEKEKLKQKIANQKGLEELISSIPPSNQIVYNSLADIRNANYKKGKEIEVICYNALRINHDEYLEYIKEYITELKKLGTGNVVSMFRRMILIYDMAYNK